MVNDRVNAMVNVMANHLERAFRRWTWACR